MTTPIITFGVVKALSQKLNTGLENSYSIYVELSCHLQRTLKANNVEY